MFKEGALAPLKRKLKPGKVYRREDLKRYSASVDRHLKGLAQEGILQRLRQGLYLCPKATAFGLAPAEEKELLRAFLKDNRFVVYNLSNLNSLGLGTTQLYNKRIVFNRMRHGEINLGGQTYYFHKWREAPKKLSKEFLVVQLLNRLDELSENREEVLKNLKKKLNDYDRNQLKDCVRRYGTYSARLKFESLSR
jgi:hypothetical protein